MSRLCWLILVCCGMGVMPISPARAQLIELNDDTPVEASGPDEWLMSRWSWVHEWESRKWPWLRDPSLVVPPQGDAPIAARPPIDALLPVAIEALTEASMPGKPSAVRQQAVLALGRIGTDVCVTRIFQVLNDKDDRVCEVAWLSLGLAHSPRAREKLLDPGTLNTSQTLGWISAIALMKEPPDNVLRTLAELVKQDKVIEVARLALWALRIHNPRGLVEPAKLIVNESLDPQMVSQALLIIGNNQVTEELSPMKAILMTRRSGVIAVSDAMIRSVTPDTTQEELYAMGATLSALRVSVTRALGQYDMAAENKYNQRAREALRLIYEEQPPPPPGPGGGRYFSGIQYTAATPYEIRFAALELGRVGYAPDIDLLIRILRTARIQDFTGRAVNARYFLRRSHAAMGLGVYLKRMTDLGIIMQPTDIPANALSADGDRALWRRNGQLEGEDPEQTRYILRKTLRALIDTATDPKEPYDLRAACVLALGMSNSPARNLDVRLILASPAGQHPMVQAYGVLALGLLGDVDTLKAAEKLLGPAREPITKVEQLMQVRFSLMQTPGQVVASRAILQGIGKIESPRAIELALSQFGRERWTSRQAVQTLRLLGDVSLVEPLAELLGRHGEMVAQDRNRGVRVPAPLDASEMSQLAAWSLGQLLRPTVSDTLAEVFHFESNYTLPLSPTLKNVDAMKQREAMYRFRCYADPLFFEGLVPALPVRGDLQYRY